MRQAMKLGFLGAILALVAAFGVLAGSGLVSAQASKGCVGSGTGGTLPPGGTDVCTVAETVSIPAGGSLQINVTAPAGSIVTNCTATGTGITAFNFAGGCEFDNNNATPFTLGVVGTETFTIPAATTVGTAVAQSASTCTTQPAFFAFANCVAAGGTVIASGPVTVSGPGAVVSAPSTVLPPLTAANFSKTCSPSGAAVTAGTATYPFVTTCTIVITAGVAGGFPSGVTVTSDTITSVSPMNAVFSCGGAGVGNPGTTVSFPNPACSNFGVSACSNTPFTTLGAASLTCTLPTITVLGATPLCEAVTVAVTGLGAVVGTPQTVNNVCVSPAFPNPPVVTAQASSATLACGGGTPVAAGGTINLTAAITTAPTQCTIAVSCIVGGATLTKCADGNLSVDMQAPNVTGIISCDGASVAPAQQACSASAGGTSLNIPCGTTAPSGTTVSGTCTSGSFNVQSVLAACLTNPLSGCVGNLNANTGCVQVLLDYEATEGNGGSSQVFGTFNICFPAPSLGALVVGCTPAVIPSNGTLASVCTATFASQVLALANGNGTGILPVVTPSSPVVASFLPGTFTWTTTGPAIFDNGRQSEVVACGAPVSAQSIGVGGLGVVGVNGITPVTFSCQGSSVLAIGNGAAGTVPINVTYQSTVGGFQAIGSTLITAVPAGVPKIGLSCSNSAGGTTIVAGGPGAVCTAQVTDVNNVPLTGLTGAGVTFSVNNPSAASVLPCSTAITVTSGISASACNLVTSPPVGSAPSQVVTTAGGLAQAVVVANPGTAGQSVTVTASLGLFVPPQFLCFLGGTVLQGVTLPSQCNSATATNNTGFSVGLTPSSLGFGGVIALPNATSASVTLTIVGSATVTIVSPASGSSIGPGCQQVIVSTSAGTQVSKIAATVTPASAVVSIWRFNNSTKLFQAGFFSDPNAPTDFNTTAGGTETYFICLSGAATIASA